MLRDNLRVFTCLISPPSRIGEREYAEIRRRGNVLSVTSSFIRNLMINYVPRLPVGAAWLFRKKLIFPRISIELSPTVQSREVVSNMCFDHDPRNATPDANSNVFEVKHVFFVIGLNMFRRSVSSS